MRFEHPEWLVILSYFLLSSCNMGPVGGKLPNKNTEIDAVAASCSRISYCGNVGLVDCGSETDLPAYYFERDTGKIIGRCGGFCMGAGLGSETTPACGPNQCPPPSWTCKPN